MRLRSWAFLIFLLVAILLGTTGRETGEEGLVAASGYFWVLTLLFLLSMIPVWHHIFPKVPHMPRLFRAVPRGKRWCDACGTPTDEGPCTVCETPPRLKRRDRKPKEPKPAKVKAKTPRKRSKGPGKQSKSPGKKRPERKS